MMYYYDPYFFLIILALGFSLWAQWKVKSTYNKYAKVDSVTGLSGADVARQILDANGLKKIPIKKIAGELSDNYDPRKKILNLSEAIYDSKSIAAYGIAAHEVGHAIQHNELYLPLQARNLFFPAASFGSNLAIPLFFAGFLFSFPALMSLGIVLFVFAVAFSVITLPVELNASNRAVAILKKEQFLAGEELVGAQKVLGAAAITYLAATLMAVLQLLRLLFLKNSRR